MLVRNKNLSEMMFLKLTLITPKLASLTALSPWQSTAASLLFYSVYFIHNFNNK